uniref:non-specific serine/threonine protein kinase n=1 Tax=Thermosporothrix sp. COM3 TaxID=2490863 RepID=A0A455SWI9_9CHLR|nr:hypothetical protein KTC_60230 [Thermosporothrix sp. COM3]
MFYNDYEDDFFEESQPRFQPMKRRATKSKPKPEKKESYETSQDVQHWLKLQEKEASRAKEFHPTRLDKRRDGAWLQSSLSQFYEEDLITDVLYVAKSGKEATVFCCTAHPSTQAELLAAKVYRPRMFRSLRNDAIYRMNRVVVDEFKQAMHDSRAKRVMSRKNTQARALQVASWIAYEYETQRLLYEAGADVPKPYSQIGNAVLMEYVGNLERQAPLLREVRLEREEVRPLFQRLLRNIELFLSCNRVHGDLSEYNVLYWNGRISVIDFAQAVDPRHGEEVFSLLLRDVERVCQFFARYGVEADAYAHATQMWAEYVGPIG